MPGNLRGNGSGFLLRGGWIFGQGRAARGEDPGRRLALRARRGGVIGAASFAPSGVGDRGAVGPNGLRHGLLSFAAPRLWGQETSPSAGGLALGL